MQGLVLVYSAGVDWKTAIQDALLTNLILGLAAFEMFMVTRHFEPRPYLRLVWSVVLAVVCTLLIQWLLEQLPTLSPGYAAFTNEWKLVRGLFAWLVLSFISAISWMWFLIMDQKENEIRKSDTEKLAREAELATLRQQLQPHFLFNSLNSISALAGSSPEQARTMIQQLSDFLRGTIKRNDQQMVTLEEELRHLGLYLDIEKVRFGHRLQTRVERDEQALPLLLPSLLLQPVVENAIKFGLYDTTGEICIGIDARQEQQTLIIRVENPFDPSTSQPREGTGFGLSSIQRRLYLLFGRNDLLTTKTEGSLFTTVIRIPQNL